MPVSSPFYSLTMVRSFHLKIVEEASDKGGYVTISVVFVSCSKLAEFVHLAFISVEKPHPVFFSLVGSSFPRYYVCKQPSVFQAASFGDLLLHEKQKKPFVSLKDEVSITQLFVTAASLAQVDNAPNEADSNLFCRDTRGLDSRSVKSFYFCCVFLLLSKTFFVSL